MTDPERLERACYEIAMKQAEKEATKIFSPTDVRHKLAWDERMIVFFEISYQGLMKNYKTLIDNYCSPVNKDK